MNFPSLLKFRHLSRKMALYLQLSTSVFFCLVPLFVVFFVKFRKPTISTKIPKSYPVIGSFFSIAANLDRRLQWISDIIQTTPNLTFTLIFPLNVKQIYTANPSNVQHILKTQFDSIYEKGDDWQSTVGDVLGDGILNVNGDKWKYQRQVSLHEFNNKALRKYVETVVEVQLAERLIPVLADAAANKTVIDFQDIIQRFGTDNICKIAFKYDPRNLSPSLPDQADFSHAFEDALQFSFDRFFHLFPLIWKVKRALNIGSEKKLRVAVGRVREFAKEIIRQKQATSSDEDLLSRFLISEKAPEQVPSEELLMDIVINFIFAGRDTSSAALTWFFWVISQNPRVESEILKEIGENTSGVRYDEVKNKRMLYTHAALCESMRFYPPVPEDFKEAKKDDTLPDGTFVKKGTKVFYNPYAMGRSEKIWGKDCSEFRPERWLKRDEVTGNWTFVSKDQYTYPVFQAGPRICMGKDMAFLQMKMVVAAILPRFKVVPVIKRGVEPVFKSYLTARMKGGFPATVQQRVEC